ncbi:M57 family metalloprotease [Aquimarina sp. AU58]|uniref:M57 family metalloprotease n=1 Tax=Aquimarina sp. AU58 TaxID=1874112 RepID=UPI000D64A627|nr:M57 family metalloprotease [Aquimarina sp. AU58]
MNFFKSLSIAIISCLILIITSCEVDEKISDEGTDEQQNDPVLQNIEKWGFSKDVIEDLGDYYLVDGDIIFYKNVKYPDFKNPISKQRRHPRSVTISNVRVFINPGMDANWRNASLQAINRWNSVNSKLKLSVTTSSSNSHIQIMYDSQDPAINLASNVFGRGTFPTGNGLPGRGIWVNPDFDSPRLCGKAITQNMRIANVQHEIGHNVGITHTNQSFGSLIPGTPNLDARSVMNGGKACTINNFSNGDKIAIRYLFPKTTPPPVGTPKTFYRFYNSRAVDHYYSTHRRPPSGYRLEGAIGKVFDKKVANTIPLYKAYNRNAKNHFYSTNRREITNASGYQYLGIAGYVYASRGSRRIPLYRFYNSTAVNHFYTTNRNEGNNAPGYRYEGVACYILR